MVSLAAIYITFALVFYTLGVWSEKFQRYLKAWHVIIFWIGLAFDTAGTTVMGEIAGSFRLNLHSITGLFAIIVMSFHVIWATLVLRSRNEDRKINFNKFSVVVWFVWLIPVIVGMLYGVGA